MNKDLFGNIRRDIIKSKRLTDAEIICITEKVRNKTKPNEEEPKEGVKEELQLKLEKLSLEDIEVIIHNIRVGNTKEHSHLQRAVNELKTSQWA